MKRGGACFCVTKLGTSSSAKEEPEIALKPAVASARHSSRPKHNQFVIVLFRRLSWIASRLDLLHQGGRLLNPSCSRPRVFAPAADEMGALEKGRPCHLIHMPRRVPPAVEGPVEVVSVEGSVACSDTEGRKNVLCLVMSLAQHGMTRKLVARVGNPVMVLPDRGFQLSKSRVVELFTLRHVFVVGCNVAVGPRCLSLGRLHVSVAIQYAPGPDQALEG